MIAQALSVSITTLLILTLGATLGITSGISKGNPYTCDKGRYPYPIVVHVQGLRNQHGSLRAKLYGDNPDDFLVSGKKLNTNRVSLTSKSVRLCLYAPAPGTYAVVVHHDENSNKKLDQNWIGMPTEGVGFSNNPDLFLAPPSHEEAAFQVVDRQTRIEIKLRY